MLRAVILVCSLHTSAADCTRATAVDVLVTPAESALPLTCLMLGQEYLAHSSIGEDMRNGDYAKISCEH